MASFDGSGEMASPAPAFPRPCLTCRRRKVRCDKLTRPCGNCARTQQLCLYDGDEAPSGTTTERIEGTSSTDRDIRERLERLEKLMEASMVGDGGTATRSGGAVANSSLSQRPPISPSPSTSSQTIIPPSTDIKNAPVGQILFQEGHSAYFDSDFWAGSITEIEDLRRLFDPVTPSPSIPSPSWSSLSTLGMVNLSPTDLSYAHPSLEESNILCKLYFASANPFVRVLHKSQFGRELSQYRRGTIDMPREWESLLFSVYLLTVSSLRPEVVEAVFSVSRETLISRYQYGCESALANVNWFRTDKIRTLQALLHYLTFLFQQNHYRDANAILGSAARIAQNMGMHRDPSHFPYSPWVFELRRRIWNQLCCLDAMSVNFYGAESCLPATMDSCPPQKANDLDWHASRFAKASSVPSASGITEMTFVLVHRVVSDATRTMAVTDPLDFEKREIILQEAETNINDNHLRGIDRNKPSHTIVAAFAEVRIANLRLCNLHRRLQKSYANPSDPGRQEVFTAALELVEALEHNANTFSQFNWEWIFTTIVPFLPLAILITLLPHTTCTSDIERTTRQIERNFTFFSDIKHPVSATPMWKLLVLLRQQMQASRVQIDVPNPDTLDQRVSNPAEIVCTDEIMLGFEDNALGNGSFGYEDQFMLQDMQDLPWLNAQMLY